MRMFGERFTGPAALLLLLPGAAVAAGSGSITIGDREWGVVASLQCSVYPGPVVAIAGHAEGDETTEITIDYDPGSNFIEAKVVGENLRLSARKEALSVTIDGDTVRGEGQFKKGWSGPTQAGSFEIDC